jgi:hypothetical protein
VKLALALAALLLGACASTESAKVPLDPGAAKPRSAALGAIAWKRNGQVLRRASWDESRIALGSGNGPAGAVLLRTTDGRWKSSDEGDSLLLAVGPDRIEGPGTKLTATRVAGGFRLQGVLHGDQFDLLLTREKAVAEGREFLRGPDGAYACPALPETRIVLLGEANRLEDPPWPQLALAAVAAQWGRGGPASRNLLWPATSAR